MCSTLIMEGAEVVQTSAKSCGNSSLASFKENLTHLDDSPPLSSPNSTTNDHESSDDDISVGCPSPALSNPNEKHYSPLRENFPSRSSSPFSQTRDNIRIDTSDNEDSRTYEGDDYFKPLKKLKMMQINKELAVKQHNIKIVQKQPVVEPTVFNSNQTGVKSFSILDILNHRPDRSSSERATSEPNASQTRIVRPWDLGTSPNNVSQNSLHRYHHRSRPKSADFCYTSETLSSSSGRSSTGGSIASSDCCTSPDINNWAGSGPTTSSTLRHAHQARRHVGHQPARTGATGKTAGAAAGAKGANTSPLDALFQMTSKTFDELNGEAVAESQANHLNLFNNRQNAKKKRKSRTAFTNHQIFELEKRFLYQKYLSPADRDEIAGSLGLSNAQVITWFQNRRAKLKRDLEELKKDVESVKVLTAHKSFLENVQDLGILKKKTSPNSISEDEKRIAAMTLSLEASGNKNL